jgi:PAS domain S-box-containing protein
MSGWISADCLYCLISIGTSLNVPIERLPRSPPAGETEEERADSIGRTIQIAFAVALALLGILGLGSYLNVVRLAEDARMVAHTDEVIANLEALLSRATDVETGERGYAITGKDSYLEPYNSGTREVIATLSRLKQLTIDNALQQRRLVNLSSVVAERLLAALVVIDARKSEGFEGAGREVLSGKEKELHDRIRELAHEMMATERELLNARQDRTERTTTFTWLLIASGYTVPTICVGFALFSIRRQLVRRAKLLATLRHQLGLLTQSKEQLQESEERFRTMANSIPQLVWITKADGFIYWYNQRRYQFTGTTPEQMEGWGWQSVHDPLVLPQVLVQWKASISTGQPFEMEFPLRRADGVYRSFLTRCLPLKDAAGQIVQWFGTNTDISSQRRVEAELREAQRITKVGHWTLRGAEVTWSEELFNIFELDSSLPAPSFDDHAKILSPESWVQLQTITNKALMNSLPYEVDLQIICSSGAHKWITWRGEATYDETEQLTSLRGTAQDITERKLTEHEISRTQSILREREEQLHLCVEHSPTAIAMFDREMKYLVVSHQWMEAYHLGEQNVIGRSHYEVFPEISSRWLAIHQRCLAGAVEQCLEDPFERSDGSVDWLRWEVRPWRQADGVIGGVIIFSENITDRKLAQEEILRLNVDLEDRVSERTMQLHAANVALDDKNIELQKAAKAKDIFLANMSHELRTPLNGIIGFAEFLVDGKPGTVNPKQKEYLEDILNSGRHLLQLISDILDLAKVGAGKMEFYPERFSLRKGIQETCAISEPMAQKRGVQIKVAVAPETSEVTLDPQKFKQVLFNLLSNAIKFNHDGGEVGISVEPYDTDRIKLVVSDNGMGIKADEVGRLFQEFEQLESGASRRHEGTGLGLALSRKIVELQGGNISVESQLGKGSNFIVVLPLVHNQGQPTVLVVDDDPDVQTFFRSFCKNIDFSRIAAGTAEDAIASLRKQKFDLMYLDLQLPDAPGDQVYKTAKHIYPDLKVIVITGYPDSEVLDRILQISPVTVLKKPLKIEQLNQTVQDGRPLHRES